MPIKIKFSTILYLGAVDINNMIVTQCNFIEVSKYYDYYEYYIYFPITITYKLYFSLKINKLLGVIQNMYGSPQQ